MWSQIIIVTTFATICLTDQVLPNGQLIKTHKAAPQKVEIMRVDPDTDLNEIIEDANAKLAISRMKKDRDLPPIMYPEDVKCLMSADKHCSKDMLRIKSALIQSIKDDCAKCTPDDKKRAGKVAISMIAHEPIAWKLFLTRSGIKLKSKEQREKLKKLKYVDVRKPEEEFHPPEYIVYGPLDNTY